MGVTLEWAPTTVAIVVQQDALRKRIAQQRHPLGSLEVISFGQPSDGVSQLAARIAAGDLQAAADLGSLVGRSLVKSR